MTAHEMKLHTRWFDAVANGAKRFEIRKDDRGGFKAGDYLILKEIDFNKNEVIFYTGRAVAVKITHVLTAEEFPAGIKEGYAILSIGSPLVME